MGVKDERPTGWWHRRWRPFAAVCGGYLAVTVGESVLAPLYSVVADDLDADLADAGLALGLLTGAIAVANIGGGYLLSRLGPRLPLVGALALVVAGGAVSAAAGGLTLFLVGQVLLGLAAGTFFAPGIQSAGLMGGTTRRGLVMGLFGVAFSGGLATAAVLSAVGALVGWRTTFVVVAALGGAGLVAVGMARLPEQPPADVTRPRSGRRWRDAFGRATAVGSAAAVSQYGTVAFFPVFAVDAWGTSAGTAALVLAAARVLSVPMKTMAGHLSDRNGPLPTIRSLGAALVVLGTLWIVAPTAFWGAVPAVAFAAMVSGAFPVANLLALEAMADRGALLGTYRSIQMGAGAVAAAAIGAGAATIGLRPTLLLTLAAPIALVAAGSTVAVVPGGRRNVRRLTGRPSWSRPPGGHGNGSVVSEGQHVAAGVPDEASAAEARRDPAPDRLRGPPPHDEGARPDSTT